jgi:undecaprenyl-diphosphatase
LIFEQVLGYHDPDGVFAVMIQLGSILAVMWLYRATIIDTAAGLGSKREARRFALMIFAAFIPSLIAGALLADYVKDVLYESFGVIAASFIIGGVVMLAVERYRPPATVSSPMHTPLGRAIVIGLCQMVALVPGVSRAGATIVGGMMVGLDRRAAAEFSFFLAMPTMLAAFVHDFVEVSDRLSPALAFEIAIGFVMAFVAAAAVVRPFLTFVGRSGFAPFAWYRIAVGSALFAALAAGWV